jgi:hypothetical protein
LAEYIDYISTSSLLDNHAAAREFLGLDGPIPPDGKHLHQDHLNHIDCEIQTLRQSILRIRELQQVTLLESARQDAVGEAIRAYSQAQVDTLNDNVNLGTQQYLNIHRWITLVKQRNAALVFKNTGWNTTLSELNNREEQLKEVERSFPSILARASISTDQPGKLWLTESAEQNYNGNKLNRDKHTQSTSLLDAESIAKRLQGAPLDEGAELTNQELDHLEAQQEHRLATCYATILRDKARLTAITEEVAVQVLSTRRNSAISICLPFVLYWI